MPPEKGAERRAWATVNKDDAGGKKPGGSGRGKRTGHPAARNKGGRKGWCSIGAHGQGPAGPHPAKKAAAATRKQRTPSDVRMDSR